MESEERVCLCFVYAGGSCGLWDGRTRREDETVGGVYILEYGI